MTRDDARHVPDNDPSSAILFEGRVRSSEIGYLNMLFESYEGLAILRTVAPKEGHIQWWVPPSRRGEFLEAIASLRDEVAELELTGERPWHPEEAS
jgi:hypothetical protein